MGMAASMAAVTATRTAAMRRAATSASAATWPTTGPSPASISTRRARPIAARQLAGGDAARPLPIAPTDGDSHGQRPETIEPRNSKAQAGREKGALLWNGEPHQGAWAEARLKGLPSG